MNQLTQDHIQALREAKNLLENPGIVAKISNTLGTPFEKGLKILPAEVKEAIYATTEKSLSAALDTVIFTMRGPIAPPSNRLNRAGATLMGAFGGAFGLPALAIGLPISTTIMLRSIADIAHSEGELLNRQEAQLAGLQVFALGGPNDDDAETGYFGIRAGLAKSVSDAAKHLASKVLMPKARRS